jgi:hypothetical protein
VKPSSPPVKSESWLASTIITEAAASVTMAKKIALTRSDSIPISTASTRAAATPSPPPTRIASKPGPQAFSIIAVP